MQVQAISVAGNACLCSQIILEDAPHESILLAAGNVIQSVSIAAGDLKGSYRTHSDLVSALCTIRDPSNNTLIVSASFDGQVDVWNPSTFETLQSYQLHRPIIKLFNIPFWTEKIDESSDSHSSFLVNCIVALVRSSNTEKKSFDIVKITVDELLSGTNNFTTVGSTLTPRLEVFAFDTSSSSSNGSSALKTYHALVGNGKKGLNFMICVEREGLTVQQSSVYYTMSDPVITFATNSSSGKVAVGHDNGQISVLTNVSEFLRQFWQLGQKRSSEIIAATHHWHAHPVLSLCFSPDGRLLYSGGEENVLVLWDLQDAGRNYLPRLGAPISRIIACQSVHRMGRVLVTTVDNTLRLINVANFEVEWMWQSANIATTMSHFSQKQKPQDASDAPVVSKASIAEQQRLQLLRSLQAYRFQDDHAERAWFAQGMINPRTGHLLINGNPGIMQEFDFYHGVIRQNHPLLQNHRVSRKDPGMRMYLPSITRFAVDASGRLLVTIDVKRGEELPKEYSLKIWEWFPDNDKNTQGSGQYRIVAQLDRPHGDHPITSLAISQHSVPTTSTTATNDELLQQVMIVTGSNDGTIKLWARKTVDEVQDMYTTATATTPATTSNGKSSSNGHHSSSSSLSSGNNNNTNQNKQYTLHKLRWKCHYAFQYRLAPVLAATFSADSSLLVVAHDNLITCWDPQTVALRASLTLQIPKKITYLSVIEPRAAAEYGQGVGDVYLVAGTNSSVTVFSMLTLQELWTREVDGIEAIATASNEQFALSPHVDTSHSTPSHYRFRSSLAQEAWISIATTSRGHEEKTIQDKDDDAASQSHQIFVFSPLSGTPLFANQISLSSKITSLTFLRRHMISATKEESKDHRQIGVMGLAVLTADSDVWVIQPRDHACSFTPGVTASVGANSLLSTTSSSTSSSSLTTTNVAQVKTPKLPTVSFKENALGHVDIDTAGDLSARVANKGVAPMGRAIASKDWLRTLLPENTEDLPKISEIAGSYLRSMITNHPIRANNPSSTAENAAFAATTAAPSSTATQASTNATMVVTEKKVTKFPVQNTEELLRRVAAKWESVLGKRSAPTNALPLTEPEVSKTPSKKSKKDTAVSNPTTPAAVAATLTPTAEKSKSTSKKTPAHKEVAADEPTHETVQEDEAVDESKSSKSKKRSSKKSSEVPAVSSSHQSTTTTSSSLPTLPEDEEVNVPVDAVAAASTTTRTSSRKRKGSDLSSIASSEPVVADQPDVLDAASGSLPSSGKKARPSSAKKAAQLDQKDNDDVSVASTATDATTPSVAARRSARQKTMTLVAMAPAAASAVVPATDVSSRTTRSRK